MTEKIQVTELTAAQRFFWLRQQAMPSVPLNMAQVTDIEGPLDRAYFLTELAEQTRRMRMMQLRFEEGPDGPRCVYDPALHDHTEFVDVGDRPDPAPPRARSSTPTCTARWTSPPTGSRGPSCSGSDTTVIFSTTAPTT